MDHLSLAECGALEDPAFSVESDEVTGLFAIDEVDDHLQLSVVVVVALLALGHTLAVKRELLLKRSVGPVAKQFAHIHAVFPTAFFKDLALVIIQAIVAKRCAGGIVDFGAELPVAVEPLPQAIALPIDNGTFLKDGVCGKVGAAGFLAEDDHVGLIGVGRGHDVGWGEGEAPTQQQGPSLEEQ